ncbi:hypothetical protein BDR07DRAFT_1492866 [Suillus spraguei]|nr:hypothetical protein BDR07DRAFT_1492866 [Suillus spraguei]
MTSASHGKCKFSTLSSTEGWQKKPCAPSTSVQAQQEGSAAMSKLAGYVGDISKSMTETTALPPSFALLISSQSQCPPSALAQATDIVHQLPDLSQNNKLDFLDYILHNEHEAEMYIYMHDVDLRAGFLDRRLKEIHRGRGDMSVDL